MGAAHGGWGALDMIDVHGIQLIEDACCVLHFHELYELFLTVHVAKLHVTGFKTLP